jgi:hypothetical protein
MKYFLLILYGSVLASTVNGQAAYPFSLDSIPFNATTRHITGKASIPVDKPFYIAIGNLRDNIALERVTAAYVYRVTIKSGKRDLIPQKTKSGASRVVPDLKPVIEKDTAAKKLILQMPALLPNMDFDILIEQNFSESSLDSFYKVIKVVKNRISGYQNSVGNLIRYINKRDPNAFIGRAQLKFINFFDFDTMVFRKIDSPFLDRILANSEYAQMPALNQQGIAATLEAFKKLKIKCPQLYFLGLIDNVNAPLLSQGLINLKQGTRFEATDQYAFNDRISNLKTAIAALVSLDSCLDIPVDPLVRVLRDSVNSDLTILRRNFKYLKDNVDAVNKIINSSGSESVWLIGGSSAGDLKTEGGNLLSTDLGIANILVKDITNTTKYIPKFYFGLNIFFRPVNRDAPLKDLPANRKLAKSNHDSSEHVDDNLSATRTIMQHLSLSVGLTFGSMNVRYFDNLFNGTSLVVGPSYRFARAFRITTGVAVLKRTNPNPLFDTEKVTAGYYASFSVDFDFLSTVKSFTNLITGL